MAPVKDVGDDSTPADVHGKDFSPGRSGRLLGSPLRNASGCSSPLDQQATWVTVAMIVVIVQAGQLIGDALAHRILCR